MNIFFLKILFYRNFSHIYRYLLTSKEFRYEVKSLKENEITNSQLRCIVIGNRHGRRLPTKNGGWIKLGTWRLDGLKASIRFASDPTTHFIALDRRFGNGKRVLSIRSRLKDDTICVLYRGRPFGEGIGRTSRGYAQFDDGIHLIKIEIRFVPFQDDQMEYEWPGSVRS